MKIGIITFHRAINYGAALQSYALLHYLSQNYGEAAIIDYNPQYMQQRYAVLNLRRTLTKKPIKLFENIMDECFCAMQRSKRKTLFEDFTNSMKLDDLSAHYDLVFLGSDQIWNPLLTGKSLDPIYWGQNINAKRICSYAPSMEITRQFDLETTKLISAYLQHIDKLSVRELSLRDFLLSKFNKHSVLVCDPVFLHSASFWLDCSLKTRPLRKPYALLYLVRVSNEIIKKVRKYCHDHKLELIVISNDSHYNIVNNTIISPLDFINYIYHSECVFSTSFHATAFSIIFRKEFYTFSMGNTGNTRVRDLLNFIGISERHITINDTIGNAEAICYDEPMRKLQSLIQNSKQYIKECCYL